MTDADGGHDHNIEGESRDFSQLGNKPALDRAPDAAAPRSWRLAPVA
jgi:hypothetical protein